MKESLEQRQRERRRRLELEGVDYRPRWFRYCPGTGTPSSRAGTRVMSPRSVDRKTEDGGDEDWQLLDYWGARKSGFVNLQLEPLW